MAIWMGETGGIRLERLATDSLYSMISPADVDVGSNRFSVERVTRSLITGDLVWIKRVDDKGQPITELLDFVDGTGWVDGDQYPDGQWYVSVDPVGGVRLYKNWGEALEGAIGKSVKLLKPSSTYRISLQVQQGSQRWLAQTQSWALNTDRDVADITSLGEGFQKNQATLVSGSGSLDCLFDVPQGFCGNDTNLEYSSYLHQLALRQEIGANFKGIFLLKRKGCMVLDGSESIRNSELFYACDCVITAVATEINTEEVIHSEIDFVTTGPIQLLYTRAADYLLQEQPPNDKILQESDFGVWLETPA